MGTITPPITPLPFSRLRKPLLSRTTSCSLLAVLSVLANLTFSKSAHAQYATDAVQIKHMGLHALNWGKQLQQWVTQLDFMEKQIEQQIRISGVLGVSSDFLQLKNLFQNVSFTFRNSPYSIQNDLNSLQDASKYTFNHLRDTFSLNPNSTTSRFGTSGHFLSAQDMHQRASSLNAQFASQFLNGAPNRTQQYSAFQSQQDQRRANLYSTYDNSVKLQGAAVENEIESNALKGKIIERMDRSEERASYNALTQEAERLREEEVKKTRTSHTAVQTLNVIQQWEQ